MLELDGGDDSALHTEATSTPKRRLQQAQQFDLELRDEERAEGKEAESEGKQAKEAEGKQVEEAESKAAESKGAESKEEVQQKEAKGASPSVIPRRFQQANGSLDQGLVPDLDDDEEDDDLKAARFANDEAIEAEEEAAEDDAERRLFAGKKTRPGLGRGSPASAAIDDLDDDML